MDEQRGETLMRGARYAGILCVLFLVLPRIGEAGVPCESDALAGQGGGAGDSCFGECPPGFDCQAVEAGAGTGGGAAYGPIDCECVLLPTHTPTGTPTRTPTLTPTPTSTLTPTATPTPKLPDGATCSDPADCLSGNCEDDVCCERECGPDEACNRVGMEGRCTRLSTTPVASRTGVVVLAVLLASFGVVVLARRARQG